MGQNFDLNKDGWDFDVNGEGCMKSLNNNIIISGKLLAALQKMHCISITEIIQECS
jgi:hypothetical protein